MEKLLETLGRELIKSPFLSIMILDDDNNIIWHNERFTKDFNQGENLTGMKCYHVTGSENIHPNCPLELSMKENKRVKGYLDFDESNFFYLTVPLDEKHAAKIHVFLPKEPDNIREIL